MRRPTNFIPFKASRPTPTAKGAADFLQSHDKLSALLPAASRLVALQNDCAGLLPTVFELCSVLHFDAGQLILAAPNAALAARLKQQLPRLQEGLQRCGWQVSAIRIKLQVTPQAAALRPPPQMKKLPQQALSSLAALEDALEDTPRNQALKDALAALVQRHRKPR